MAPTIKLGGKPKEQPKKSPLRMVGENVTTTKEKPKEQPKEQPKQDTIKLKNDSSAKAKFKSQRARLESDATLPSIENKTLRAAVRVGTSPKTTVVLGATLAAVTTAAVLTGTLGTGVVGGLGRSSGSLIGKHVNVDAIGKTMGLTARQTAALAKEVGRRRIAEIANTITNPKAAGLMQNILTKTFSKESLALLGSGAGTIFLGKWGQAEAGEPLSIVMKDLSRQAELDGNWDLYWEASAARDELTNLGKWESILSNTPFISPFVGIPNKIKGIIQAGRIMDELARIKQQAQEEGISEDQVWEQREKDRVETREREKEEDKIYYADIDKREAESKAAGREEDKKYYADLRKNQEEYDKNKREAEAKYYENIKKANDAEKAQENKQYQEYSKSQLSFGLL